MKYFLFILLLSIVGVYTGFIIMEVTRRFDEPLDEDDQEQIEILKWWNEKHR